MASGPICQTGAGRWDQVSRFVAMVLALLAAAYFVYRGPVRATGAMADYMETYAASRAWVMGANPYDLAAVQHIWMNSGVPADYTPDMVDLPSLYPPSALVVFSPWSCVRWPIARQLWLMANILGMIVILMVGTRMGGLRVGSTGHWLLMAALLALSPIHTAITMGQSVPLIMAMTLLGLDQAMRGHDKRAGLWLGLAIAIKPQVAGLFVAYYLLRGRWRLATVAFGCVAIIALAGAAPLWWMGYPWWTDWQANLHTMRSGGYADFTEANAGAYKLTNLLYPVYQVVRNQMATSLICIGMTGGLFVWAVARTWRLPRTTSETRMALALMAVLTLLPVYHLFYDATVLAIVIVMVASLGSVLRQHRLWTSLLAAGLLMFVVPLAVALAVWQQAGRLPGWLTDGWWWRTIVLPSQCWALALLAGVLMYAVHRRWGEVGATS